MFVEKFEKLRCQDIQIVASRWVLVYETECIFEYIFCTATH